MFYYQCNFFIIVNNNTKETLTDVLIILCNKLMMCKDMIGCRWKFIQMVFANKCYYNIVLKVIQCVRLLIIIN